MPTKTYMVIDARRDHSLRVPRPDFSVEFGTPSACTQCHADRPATWAAAAVARWYGSANRQEPGFVAALDAGRRGRAEAEPLLAALATDGQQVSIARATALADLAPYLSARSFPAVESAARDQDAPNRRRAGAGHARRPAGREVLVALIGIERERGARAEARAHAEQLVRLAPDDPAVMALLTELGVHPSWGCSVSRLLAMRAAAQPGGQA